MPALDEITTQQLSRIIGLPGAPRLIDVRPDDVRRLDPRLVPTALSADARCIRAWAGNYRSQKVVVYCHDGGALSQGAAAWLRNVGADAEVLAGGFEAWVASGQLLIRSDKLPRRDEQGRTTWVTRARPKIVRIACPWLIRRFIDPDALFLFVAASEVAAVAEQYSATPFDTGHGLWNDRGERCTFDVMLNEFGLASTPINRLADMVRGADTGKLDLAPQCAGLLAASLGFSRMFRDDRVQLDAAMPLYDALYRWSRDAAEETHG